MVKSSTGFSYTSVDETASSVYEIILPSMRSNLNATYETENSRLSLYVGNVTDELYRGTSTYMETTVHKFARNYSLSLCRNFNLMEVNDNTVSCECFKKFGSEQTVLQDIDLT